MSVYVITVCPYSCLSLKETHWRNQKERLRHWSFKFHTGGSSAHACANDWPWPSHVAVAAPGQWQRNAGCDCTCLGFVQTLQALYGCSVGICHAFQTTTQIMCSPGRQPHQYFSRFFSIKLIGTVLFRLNGFMLSSLSPWSSLDMLISARTWS